MKKVITVLSLVLVVLMALSGCIIHIPAASSPQPTVLAPTPSPAAATPSATVSADVDAIVESPVLDYVQATAQQVAAVESLVAAKQKAIRDGDVAALLATVSPEDPWYMQEQKNLARSLKDFPVASFSLGVKDVMAAGSGELKAAVTQTYTYKGQMRSCTYTERFVPKDGALLDAGLAWNALENGAVRVTYAAKAYRDVAMQSVNTVTAHLRDLEGRFGFTPDKKISIRIYDDSEIFTESIKLHLTTYQGGWTEYGESLKLMLGSTDFEDDYHLVLCHESTHYYLANMTNDNACYWMQEGLATMVENGIQGIDDLRVGRDYSLMELDKKGRLPGFDWLNETNPELLIDDGSIDAYYAAASFAVAWFIDTYGFEDFKKVCDALRSDPYIEGTAAEKIPELNEYCLSAMERITGHTRADFKAGYDKAIKEYVDSLKD